MSSITTLQYAQMANRVYNIDNPSDPESYTVPGFIPALFKEGMAWGKTNTGFKGCVYVSQDSHECVVAFQGTKPSKAGDLVADVQIFLGQLTQYAGAALRLFNRCAEVYPNHQASLAGHSLGGAIAQVIGHWTGAPFVTFNAPGMWGQLQFAKVNPFAGPKTMWRSIKGTVKGSLAAKQKAATGRNFRNVLDPVSGFGSHYGPVTRFWGKGAHSMDDVEARIRSSRWARVNPLDSAVKEWGEL